MSDALGFIGVGAMGSALAGRFIDGHDLYVYDRAPRATAQLVARGAKSALGRSLGAPLFLHSVCTRIYEMSRAAGFGRQDATAIVKVYEQLTGTTVANKGGRPRSSS
jgi:3-hydroxyisobutyrate dehydrogenase-like beta-hydroxyacid dehydrogenase